MFTEKAQKKKVEGTVMFRVVFEASGVVKVLNVLKRLPHGLTEQALEAAGRIKFEPAMLDNTPVSQMILLQYNFNR
jgi:TonB family protein